jgi:hypothetical protein
MLLVAEATFQGAELGRRPHLTGRPREPGTSALAEADVKLEGRSVTESTDEIMEEDIEPFALSERQLDCRIDFGAAGRLPAQNPPQFHPA